MKRQKGLALIVVLWVISLLTIMASSFSLTIQRETAIAAGIKERAEAGATAEAGINYAILMLLSNDKEVRWQAFDSVYKIEYAGREIRLKIADESGKLNINLASKVQLQQLLNSYDLEEDHVESLSDAILDWRDENDEIEPNGAEKTEYSNAGLNYEPRNANFNSIEELQMVLGMSAKIYQKMEEMVSIYTQNKDINPTTATREILLTLPGISAEIVDEYLQQRVDNERNHEPVVAPEWYQGDGAQSHVYRIVSEAMIDKGITETVVAVIRKGRSQNQLPFEIVKWQSNPTMPSLFLAADDQRVIN